MLKKIITSLVLTISFISILYASTNTHPTEDIDASVTDGVLSIKIDTKTGSIVSISGVTVTDFLPLNMDCKIDTNNTKANTFNCIITPMN